MTYFRPFFTVPNNKAIKYVLGIFVIILLHILGGIPYGWIYYYDIDVPSYLSFMAMMIPFVLGFLGIVFFINKVHGVPFLKSLTFREKFDWKRVGYTFSIWAIVVVVLTLIDVFLENDNYEIVFNPSVFFVQLILSMSLFPIQVLFEELFFRAYLAQFVSILFNRKWITFFIPAIIFGLAHIFNPEIDKMGLWLLVYYIFSGIIMGIMMIMDDGLELVLGYHLAHNLISSTLVTSDWNAIQINAIFKTNEEPSIAKELVVISLLNIIFIIILSKKYKWKNWRKKLLSGRVYNSSLDV